MCANYDVGMTEDDARRAFLDAYSDLHAYPVDEWELAMKAEVFVHLGDGVRQHPAFRCMEEQAGNGADGDGHGTMRTVLVIAAVGTRVLID